MTKAQRLAVQGYRKGIENYQDSMNKYNLTPKQAYYPILKIKFLKRMIRNTESR